MGVRLECDCVIFASLTNGSIVEFMGVEDEDGSLFILFQALLLRRPI